MKWVELIKNTILEHWATGSTIKLADLYRYKNKFAKHYPNNTTIEATIQRSIQILIKEGFLQFVERGMYRVVKSSKPRQKFKGKEHKRMSSRKMMMSKKKIGFPLTLIDQFHISKINISGKGGKEKLIARLLPSWDRVSNKESDLYDFQKKHNNQLLYLEIKKQANGNWLDSGKYYNLSSQNRDIFLMFVNHKKGDITSILVTRLGRFIDWLCKNREAHGWNNEVLKKAAEYKKRFPKLQFKVPIWPYKVYEETKGLLDVVYKK